jgi:predicted ester cyclase
MGIPATGKQVSVADMHIERIVDGKIVERFGVTDMMGLLQQLGAIPVPQ